MESTDKFWRLILFEDEKVDSENLYDELHDILWLASLQVRKLKENDLPWLLQASDMLKSYVDRTASESCFDFVFGERSY